MVPAQQPRCRLGRVGNAGAQPWGGELSRCCWCCRGPGRPGALCALLQPPVTSTARVRVGLRGPGPPACQGQTPGRALAAPARLPGDSSPEDLGTRTTVHCSGQRGAISLTALSPGWLWGGAQDRACGCRPQGVEGRQGLGAWGAVAASVASSCGPVVPVVPGPRVACGPVAEA